MPPVGKTPPAIHSFKIPKHVDGITAKEKANVKTTFDETRTQTWSDGAHTYHEGFRAQFYQDTFSAFTKTGTPTASEAEMMAKAALEADREHWSFLKGKGAEGRKKFEKHMEYERNWFAKKLASLLGVSKSQAAKDIQGASLAKGDPAVKDINKMLHDAQAEYQHRPDQHAGHSKKHHEPATAAAKSTSAPKGLPPPPLTLSNPDEQSF
jgi:hypothetical protein